LRKKREKTRRKTTDKKAKNLFTTITSLFWTLGAGYLMLDAMNFSQRKNAFGGPIYEVGIIDRETLVILSEAKNLREYNAFLKNS